MILTRLQHLQSSLDTLLKKAEARKEKDTERTAFERGIIVGEIETLQAISITVAYLIGAEQNEVKPDPRPDPPVYIFKYGSCPTCPGIPDEIFQGVGETKYRLTCQVCGRKYFFVVYHAPGDYLHPLDQYPLGVWSPWQTNPGDPNNAQEKP